MDRPIPGILGISNGYAFRLFEPDGKSITIGGEFREVDPPKKFVYIWILDSQGCEGSDGFDTETLVVIESQDLGTATQIILTHDFLQRVKFKGEPYDGIERFF